MRVVIDSNVLARAAPGRRSPARQVLDLLIVSPHVLISSEFMLEELGRIMRYDRLRSIHGLDDASIDEYVQAVRDASFVVDVPAVPTAIVPSDPNDDPIVATALEGQADIICTWDKDLFELPVQQYLMQFGIRVLRDADLLRELRSA